MSQTKQLASDVIGFIIDDGDINEKVKKKLIESVKQNANPKITEDEKRSWTKKNIRRNIYRNVNADGQRKLLRDMRKILKETKFSSPETLKKVVKMEIDIQELIGKMNTPPLAEDEKTPSVEEEEKKDPPSKSVKQKQLEDVATKEAIRRSLPKPKRQISREIEKIREINKKAQDTVKGLVKKPTTTSTGSQTKPTTTTSSGSQTKPTTTISSGSQTKPLPISITTGTQTTPFDLLDDGDFDFKEEKDFKEGDDIDDLMNSFDNLSDSMSNDLSLLERAQNEAQKQLSNLESKVIDQGIQFGRDLADEFLPDEAMQFINDQLPDDVVRDFVQKGIDKATQINNIQREIDSNNDGQISNNELTQLQFNSMLMNSLSNISELLANKASKGNLGPRKIDKLDKLPRVSSKRYMDDVSLIEQSVSHYNDDIRQYEVIFK